jgi:hypothetical protein
VRGSGGGRRRLAGGKRVNVFPASVLNAVCTRRLRPVRGIYIEAREVAEATGDGGWPRGVAQE